MLESAAIIPDTFSAEQPSGSEEKDSRRANKRMHAEQGSATVERLWCRQMPDGVEGGWVWAGKEGSNLSLSVEGQVNHLASVVLSVVLFSCHHSQPSVVPPIAHVCLPFSGSSGLLRGPPRPFIYPESRRPRVCLCAHGKSTWRFQSM